MNIQTGNGRSNGATTKRFRKKMRVKGGNDVEIDVKEVLDGRVYIACEEMDGLKVGRRAFRIRKGAVLVRNTAHDHDGVEFYMVFNDGIYDVLRSQGAHVPDGYGREDAQIVCYKGTLQWGLEQTWLLNKRSPEADVKEYGARVAGVEEGLLKSRDEHKAHARTKAGAAKSHVDRRKRVNFSSRSPIIWSADHALSRRTLRTRKIRPRISLRNARLLEVADAAWEMKVDSQREVAQALTWWAKGPRPPARVAQPMAERLSALSDRLKKVSIAPYSRRGFPRIADDLGNAACALYEGRFDAACDLLVRCARAFRMMDARRTLEEACTMASRVHKAKAVPTAEDIASLVALLTRVEAVLVVDGQPIDLGFEHSVIADRVLPELVAAKEAARSLEEYQPKEVFRALKAAAAPL